MKLKKVLDTGIKRGHSNGERTQEIIFENDKNEKYRVYIESESYVDQSYARLYKWTNDNGWGLITSKNPKRDYNIDISYQENYSALTFEPIVRDLKKIICRF